MVYSLFLVVIIRITTNYLLFPDYAPMEEKQTRFVVLLQDLVYSKIVMGLSIWKWETQKFKLWCAFANFTMIL